MGRTADEQARLVLARQDAQLQVTIGGLYRHHKSADKVYEVLDIGVIEANDELCVIYQAQYGEHLTFVRPLRVWLEQVEWEGQTVPRFTKL